MFMTMTQQNLHHFSLSLPIQETHNFHQIHFKCTNFSNYRERNSISSVTNYNLQTFPISTSRKLQSKTPICHQKFPINFSIYSLFVFMIRDLWIHITFHIFYSQTQVCRLVTSSQTANSNTTGREIRTVIRFILFHSLTLAEILFYFAVVSTLLIESELSEKSDWLLKRLATHSNLMYWVMLMSTK